MDEIKKTLAAVTTITNHYYHGICNHEPATL